MRISGNLFWKNSLSDSFDLGLKGFLFCRGPFRDPDFQIAVSPVLVEVSTFQGMLQTDFHIERSVIKTAAKTGFIFLQLRHLPFPFDSRFPVISPDLDTGSQTPFFSKIIRYSKTLGLPWS